MLRAKSNLYLYFLLPRGHLHMLGHPKENHVNIFDSQMYSIWKPKIKARDQIIREISHDSLSQLEQTFGRVQHLANECYPERFYSFLSGHCGGPRCSVQIWSSYIFQKPEIFFGDHSVFRPIFPQVPSREQ